MTKRIQTCLPARLFGGLLCAVLALSSTHLQAQTEAQVPSLDAAHGSAPLRGHWFAADGASPRPAIVLLHGCGGAYDAQGRLATRMLDYSALLNAQGWHALVLDSLTSRGERQLCTQPMAGRKITQVQRRRDALGALQWLAARDDVDPARLVLLGWSHGGSTVLAATNLNQREVRAAPTRPRVAVAFYPGCSADLQRNYAPSAPLLLQIGGADDWTPAAPCEALVASAAEPRPRLVVHPGAHHGFDSNAPVRLRRDVPNGVNPGQGVHVGGQPEALARSREELLGFLRRALE